MCTGHFAVKVDDRDQMLLNLDKLGVLNYYGPQRVRVLDGGWRGWVTEGFLLALNGLCRINTFGSLLALITL